MKALCWHGKEKITCDTVPDAMMRGDGDVVSGWKNKLQSTIANVLPNAVLAEQHRKQAEPGSGED